MSANVSRAVLVVGAGVAGLAAACGLQRQGYQVTVVERNAAPKEPSGELQARVSAFSPASIRFLASLGAWPADSDRIRPYGNMWVWTDGDFDHVHFSAAEMGKSELGAIAENGLIQHALYVAALKAGVQFEFEAEWSDLDNQANAVALSLQDGRRLEAGWLVVAEGAQSKLREALGVASRGWRYEQQALVCS
ncbi:MAG: FAD-dependent oxidoreductase, partial [Gammaproteobacteria bacterium]|nr:FAD-dependent oxidoreductase [Gammaproteobacteria bacterium]